MRPLSVQSIGGDNDALDTVDAVDELEKHRNLIGLGADVDLAEHHASAMLDGGQQMPRPGDLGARASHGFAVHRDDLPFAGSRFGACRRPLSDRGVQLVAIESLQGTANTGLARQHVHPQRREQLLGRISRPLTDRGKRACSGQHRAHRHCQNRRDRVPHTPPLAGIRNSRRHRQHTRTGDRVRLGRGSHVSERRGDQR